MKFKFKSDEKELSPISFLFLILSDICILCLLFASLSAQIKQYPDEYDYFPTTYRSILSNKSWNKDNIVDKICENTLERNLFSKHINAKAIHPDCKKIEDLLNELSNDSELYKRFEEYKKLKKDYDTNYNLHEAEKRETLFLQLETEKNSLYNTPKVNEIINTVFDYQTRDYKPAIRNFKKLFALKRVGLDLAFLIPLIALLLLWNRVSYKKHWSISLTISSHYILLPFIPIMFELVRLIVEVLPENLLKELYDFLVSLKLVGIWYYFAIALSILFIVFIVWLFQTKLFTKEKYFVKRYTSGRCMKCNSKINYNENFCPVCGDSLKIECPDCKKTTVKNLPYCLNCGRKN